MTQTNQLIKTVVSTGVGKINKDQKVMERVLDNLAKITGQQPVKRTAKKAIAGFKVRQGDTVGYLVTLRGKRMNDFLTKLAKVVLPANRDFKGIQPSSIDGAGNLTIGITDMTTFPEIQEQSGTFQHGLEITLVPRERQKNPQGLYENLGIPFKK
ncbi:50S ribosomal protein L5 [Candidatus Berkelbacteria bacterium]|nr:50S ribosomal protein L5 [Candidatus Berkelbacteria bacterium]